MADFQDYLADYEEVDPSTKITLTSSTVTWSNQEQDEVATVTEDFGANYFSGDLLHQFDGKTTYMSVATFATMWCLANVIGDGQDLSNDVHMEVYWYNHESKNNYKAIMLKERDSGNSWDGWYSMVIGTQYYIEVERDEAVGANGTIYCRIYSNSDYTGLIDTLSIALDNKRDYRYLYAFANWKTNNTNRTSGVSSNLNIDVSSIAAVVTGTATATIDEADVVAGGDTIIVTLTGDTWVASGGTFDAQRQNIIDGLDSAQSETYGWNAEVRDKEVVGAVVRTSDTVATITLTAASAYDITAQEVITTTIPASALVTSASPLVATPTFSVDFISAGALINLLQGSNLGADLMNGAIQ